MPLPATHLQSVQTAVKIANAPDLSFRGAKRRGNLLQPVTFSPRPTCYPTWYCEIATSAVGLLAMTKLTASRHKINAANNWRPAWRSQPAIGFHVLSPPCTSRQCLPEIATAPLGPRNDKSRVFTVLTIACTNRKRYAGSGCPLPYRVHALNRSIRRSSAVTRRQFPWAAARSAPSPFCRPRPNRSTPCPKSPRHCFGPVYLRP